MLRQSGSRGWQEGDDLTAGAFDRVVRLVPNSGLQFLEADLPRDVAEHIGRSFVRERITVGGRTHWALNPSNDHRPAADADPDGLIRISGMTAIRSACDRWLPLPLFRYLSRHEDGAARFDEGPANWARVYITTPDAAVATEDAAYRIIVAIDTELAAVSKLDAAPYASPTLDDVRFSSLFALTDRPDDLAGLLAETWVQRWLDEAFHRSESSSGYAGIGGDLEPIALYLTLLTVLARARIVPPLRFLSARPESVRPRPVDLVIDVGACRTTSMLVDRDPASGRVDMTSVRLLPVRDFTRPGTVHRGAIDSVVAFARAPFGDEAYSRKSGRLNAFHWPSLVRMGPEAMRLIAGCTGATEGLSGLISPSRFVADDLVAESHWRFAASPRMHAGRRPMVVGRMLAHTTGQGLLPPPDAKDRPAIAKPQFSLSAISSFYIAEIVLQALCAINAPVSAQAGHRRREMRRALGRVILCLPASMPAAVQDLIGSRAEAGIAMLWRSLDWQNPDAPYAVDVPVVTRGLDATLSVQLAYLFDEVMQRFAGDAGTYLETVGRVRPGIESRPSLRVGSLDIGATASRLTVASYSIEANAPLRPSVLEQSQHPAAGDEIATAVMRSLVVPAIAYRLGQCGMPDADRFLAPFGDAAAAPPRGRLDDLPARFSSLWLRPLAAALVALDIGRDAGPPRDIAVSLDQLLAGAGHLDWTIASEFEQAASAAGASGFSLAGLLVRTTTSDLAGIIADAARPMVDAMMAAMAPHDCDLVLLSGGSARLATVLRLFRERMPWRPDRIVDLTNHAWQVWYPLGTEDRALCEGKDVALVGTLLAAAGDAGDARTATAANAQSRAQPNTEPSSGEARA